MELSALAPFVFSALLCMGISPVLIPYLHRLKFDQTIRENGPTWHNAKGKTPTMGGLAFVAGTTAGVLLGGLVCLGRMPTNAVLVLLCALSFGFVGFIDDYIKVVKKRNLGLTPAQKLVLQVLAAAAFLMLSQYETIGFLYGRPHRRRALFFSLGGVLLGLTALADGLPLATSAITLAYTLSALAMARALLQNSAQSAPSERMPSGAQEEMDTPDTQTE